MYSHVVTCLYDHNINGMANFCFCKKNFFKYFKGVLKSDIDICPQIRVTFEVGLLNQLLFHDDIMERLWKERQREGIKYTLKY